MNATVTFESIVQLGGKTATGIPVPDEVVAALGASRKPAVRVRIGHYSYRSTVAVRGGGFKIPLSAENRVAAGVAAGDPIWVELALDTAPRDVEVPADLDAAMDARARSFFESLSPGQKKWYVLPIEEAKKPETRARRVEKAIAMLHEGRKR